MCMWHVLPPPSSVKQHPNYSVCSYPDMNGCMHIYMYVYLEDDTYHPLALFIYSSIVNYFYQLPPVEYELYKDRDCQFYLSLYTLSPDLCLSGTQQAHNKSVLKEQVTDHVVWRREKCSKANQYSKYLNFFCIEVGLDIIWNSTGLLVIMSELKLRNGFVTVPAVQR